MSEEISIKESDDVTLSMAEPVESAIDFTIRSHSLASA